MPINVQELLELPVVPRLIRLWQTPSALARALNVTRQRVTQMQKSGRVPTQRHDQIERLGGNMVSGLELYAEARNLTVKQVVLRLPLPLLTKLHGDIVNHLSKAGRNP